MKTIFEEFDEKFVNLLQWNITKGGDRFDDKKKEVVEFFQQKLEAIKKEVSNLKSDCYNCEGTEKKYYGECKCAYSYKILINLKDVLETFKKFGI